MSEHGYTEADLHPRSPDRFRHRGEPEMTSPKPAPDDRDDLIAAMNSWRTVAEQMNRRMLELQNLADLYAQAEQPLDGPRVARAIHATIAEHPVRPPNTLTLDEHGGLAP